MGFYKICGCSQQQVTALLYVLGYQGKESGVVLRQVDVGLSLEVLVWIDENLVSLKQQSI